MDISTNGDGAKVPSPEWKEKVLKVAEAAGLPEKAQSAGLMAMAEAMRQELAEPHPDELLPIEPTFKPLTFLELLNKPPKEWLVTGLLGKRDIAMIFGEAGSGKTFIVIDLITSAALGNFFAGTFPIPRPLKVAYCAGEGLGGLQARFAASVNQKGATSGEFAQLVNDNLTIFEAAPQFYDKGIDATIDRFVSDWQARSAGPLDLLIVDTLHSAIWGADENHSMDMGMVLRSAKYAVEALGCTVGFVHHANRAGNYRGSSALHGSMDTIIQVKYSKLDKVGTVECFKLKDAEEFKPLYFRLRPEDASASVYPEWLEASTVQLSEPKTKKELVKQAIIELLEGNPDGLSQSQIVKRVTEGSRNTILIALGELEQKGALLVKWDKGAKKIYQLKLDIDV